jgi:putative membrane protein insertion efficiency factor
MRTVSRLLLWLIRAYQLSLSPWLGSNCRFYPSCSCYAHTAIERYGALQGAWLGLRRLLRCHPLHKGGYDPVPVRE